MENICSQLKLENEQTIIAAVSGGSDSLALLVLLQNYLDQLAAIKDVPLLVAVTVDHGLRQESAAEAQAVKRFCEQRKIRHITKLWKTDKPATGISVAAREMRYHLLIEAAREVGASMIFTGHSQDDQVETYIMRQARQPAMMDGHVSDMRGLAGMAAFTLLQKEFLLVRPLLHTRRETLRDQLRERGIRWIDDPTNADMHYERPRIRQARQESDHHHFLAFICRAVQKRQELNQQVIDYWDAYPNILQQVAPDIVLLDRKFLAQMPQDAASVFIGFVLALTGGRNFLTGTQDRNRILKQMLLAEMTLKRMNYAGCIIETGKNHYRIWRERRNLPDIIVAPQTNLVWDQRYRVENHGHQPIEVRPARMQDFHAFCVHYELNRQDFFQPAVCASPAIYIKNQLCALPALDIFKGHAGDISVSKQYALLDNVLTGHDFALAERFYRYFSSDERNPVVNICRKFHKNRL